MRWAAGAAIRFLMCKPCGQGALFFCREPARICRLVIEVPECGNSERNSHKSLDEKHRLPALQSSPGRHFKQQAGERAAKNERNWNAEIEEAENFAAHATWEPVCEIQNCPREKPRFEDSKDEPQYVERLAAADKHGRHGGQSPANHEKREPLFCTDLVKDEIAGESAEGIADEEQARGKRVCLL